MIGTGTLVNTAAVLVGGIVGTLAKSALKDRYKEVVMQAIGLSVCLIGLSGALQGILKARDGGLLDRDYLILMTLSLVFGGLLGEWIDIERRLETFGNWIQRRMSGRGGSTFTEGFVTASLLYCVGAMAIVGSLEDGLTGDPTTLLTKSILDGVTAVLFASTLGIGVAFSAGPILLYQGAITLLAGAVAPLLSDVLVLQLSLVGSVLIFAIGLDLLGIRRIRVGNLLPALLGPILWSLFP